VNHNSWDYDVAIVGGGPAGSAAATALARAGKSVLILERDRFPRFHVGESLLPMSSNLFRELGLESVIEEGNYQEKRGASFISECGEKRYRIDFSFSDEVEHPVARHVTRSEFDERLLRNAESCGATVLEGVRAAEFRNDEDGVRVQYDDTDGSRKEVKSGFLLDASGRFGFLARRMGLRIPDQELRMVALFAHFDGVSRESGVTAGDIRIVTREDLGWWWVIPLSNDRTSVGLVFPTDKDPRRKGESDRETLVRCANESSVMREILGRAECAGEAHVEADFSYGTRAYGGEHFLLLGDAGSFLDPVFSTGVELALQSGLEGAREVIGALDEQRSLSGRRLKRFEKLQRRRYAFYRRFVTNFYKPFFRDMLYGAAEWPRITRAMVVALAGYDRPRLRTRLLLWWVFFTVGLRARQSRESAPTSAVTADRVAAPVPDGTH